MVGSSGRRAAVMGAIPQSADTESEVRAFVKSLLEHDRIEVGKAKKSAVAASTHFGRATHAIKSVGGKKVLQRIRFQCGNCRA
jgi:hypothetical protein